MPIIPGRYIGAPRTRGRARPLLFRKQELASDLHAAAAAILDDVGGVVGDDVEVDLHAAGVGRLQLRIVIMDGIARI